MMPASNTPGTRAAGGHALVWLDRPPGCFSAPLLGPRPTLLGTLLLLLVASSSVVSVEPAPFDLLAVGLFAWLCAQGLRLPRETMIAVFLLAVFLLAHVPATTYGLLIDGAGFVPMAVYSALTAYLVVVFVLFASIVAVDPVGGVRAIFCGWMLAALLATTLAIGATLGVIGSPETFMKFGRAKGLFKDPNVYAPFLVPMLLYALHVALTARTALALGASALLAYLFVGLMLSFSRGGILNLGIAVVVMCAINARAGDWARHSSRIVPRLLAVAVTGMVLVGALAASDRLDDILGHRLALVQEYDTKRDGRFAAQALSLRVGLQTPTGKGPNRRAKPTFLDPHNVYIKVLIEYGIAGIISFMAFSVATLVLGLRASLRASVVQPALVIVYAAVVASLLQSLFIDSLHWRHLFVLLGMQWGLMAWSSVPHSSGAGTGDTKFAEWQEAHRGLAGARAGTRAHERLA